MARTLKYDLDTDTTLGGNNASDYIVPSQKAIKSYIDNHSGGVPTDVQINGTTITANNVANIMTNGTYNATSNKIATMSDLPTVPTNVSAFTNDAGYLTGISSSDVTTALGYTPYDSSNPNGYTSNVGTVTSVNNVSPVDGNVSLSIPTVPENISYFNNDIGYITGINSTNVTSALGYTPTSPANVDGQWVYSYSKLETSGTARSFTVNLGTTGTDAKNYLPADNYSYLVQLAAHCSQKSGTTSASTLRLVIGNDAVILLSVNKDSGYSDNAFFVVVDSNRTFDLQITTGFGSFILYAIGYRRLGTNT